MTNTPIVVAPSYLPVASHQSVPGDSKRAGQSGEASLRSKIQRSFHRLGSNSIQNASSSCYKLLCPSNYLSETPETLVTTLSDFRPDEVESTPHNVENGSTEFLSEFVEALGTYMVHDEPALTTPDFYDSPYAKRQPWEKSHYRTNWGFQQFGFGLFRSIFKNGTAGNYENFYDMFGFSQARSFSSSSLIPSYYSTNGNCSETSFVAPNQHFSYKSQNQFVLENRSYTRSYFNG